jgi:phage gp36-like protein
MYCTRADIETKRLPRQNLIQLTDDEMLGEWDDTAAPLPAESTAWLLSNGDSAINVRVAEAIESAVSEIHFYLANRYPLPLDPVPDFINAICVALAVYNLFMRRNVVDVQNAMVDTALLGYNQAIAKLKMLSEGKLKIEIPNPETGGTVSTRTLVSAPKLVFANLSL